MQVEFDNSKKTVKYVINGVLVATQASPLLMCHPMLFILMLNTNDAVEWLEGWYQ